MPGYPAAMQQVVVIGAGIIGASLAFHLVQLGASVTVLEARISAGNATAASFAWINAGFGNDAAYFNLRWESIGRWRRLEQQVEGLGLSWGGSLTFDMAVEDLRNYVEEFNGRGYPLRLVGEEQTRELEPGLRRPPELAAFAEAEGAAEPATAAAALLRASGAKVVQTAVQGIDVKAGRATGVMTAEGPLAADWVAVAAGAQMPALLNTAGVRFDLDQPAGLLVHTRALPRLLRRLAIAPQIHLRQTINGEIVAGSDFGGSEPNPNALAAAEKLMGQIRNEILGAEAAQLARYSVGYRPTPKDGRPIIGEVPGIEGLYVTVMHSGITNAPAVGAFAAEEIVHGRRHALIAPYGIGRFL